MLKNKYIIPLLILVQLILVTSILHFTGRMSWGFDLQAADEGFYLDAVYRLLLGDKPFVHEVYTTTRGFDVILAFFMKIAPNRDLITLRWISFGFEAFIITLSILAFLKQTKQDILVFLMTPLLIYKFSYHQTFSYHRRWCYCYQ